MNMALYKSKLFGTRIPAARLQEVIVTMTDKDKQRGAYHSVGIGMDFDVSIQLFPNRESLLLAINMQSKREPKSSDLRLLVK
jgi:hypothetical protein